MHIFAASASIAITRTLQTIIHAAGHELSPPDLAELLLIDTKHPYADPLPELPRILLGTPTTQGDSLAAPLRPQQLARLLNARRTPQILALNNGWQLDLMARAITHAAQPAVTLTEKEAALLGLLAQSQPMGVPRDTLLAQVWGVRADVDTHTLETHLYRLRSKLNELDPAPCDIVTEDGHYKITFLPA